MPIRHQLCNKIIFVISHAPELERGNVAFLHGGREALEIVPIFHRNALAGRWATICIGENAFFQKRLSMKTEGYHCLTETLAEGHVGFL